MKSLRASAQRLRASAKSLKAGVKSLRAGVKSLRASVESLRASVHVTDYRSQQVMHSQGRGMALAPWGPPWAVSDPTQAPGSEANSVPKR